MNAQSDIRERTTPMVALTGAVAIAAAAMVSSPPVQYAAENAVSAVVHEEKSLPVALTSGVDFFAPYYYMPAGAAGTAITIPLYVVTYAADTLVKGVTQVLTNLHVDNRLAQQPSLLTHELLFPILGGVQGAVASALDGTYVLGKFTPAQALNFIITTVKTTIEGFVAAEKALFGVPSLTAKTAGAAAAIQDVASPVIANSTPTVTLSTAQADLVPKPTRKLKTAEADAAAQPSVPDTAVDAAGDTKKADVPTADTTVKKPAFKLPTLKLPTFKLPRFKLPTLKTTAGATKAEKAPSSEDTAGAPKADHGTKDGGTEGSSK